ncbi:MAG: hypothetical protein ACYC0L_03170 [Thermoleophilia bacterium]
MKSKTKLYFAVTFLYLLTTQASLVVFDDQTIGRLTKENGLFESLGASYLLLASMLLFILFLKTKNGNNLHFFKTKRNYLFLLLALLFFMGSGEEISWGQQIFHWDTPEFIKEINVQGETNIHNIRVFSEAPGADGGKSIWRATLNFNRLFTLFGVAFCILIPITAKASLRISSWLKRVGIPLVPLWLGALFMLSYIFLKFAQTNTTDLAMKLDYVEIAESNLSFVFFVITLWWVINLKSGSTDRPTV